MRIIAGNARGRSLCTPKGMDTRPTQDYVRESLFNILQRDVPGARVLDLFAGSGALGLEALSRGAETAAFVDISGQAAECVQKNAETMRFCDQAEIFRGDWQTALNRFATEGRNFSIVFLDPPYRMSGIETICARLAERGLLEQDALVVVERCRGDVPKPDERFALKDSRRYGATEIYFLSYHQEGAGHA